MIPQHLSLTNEHPTPPHIVEAARRVLKVIDLDPATTEQFNQSVQAAHWIGLPNDGLAEQWAGRVFLNPPGGRTPPQWRKRFATNSNATAWWRKFCEEYSSGRVTNAIFVGFTLEILRTSQDRLARWPGVMNYTYCVPEERLAFSGSSPTHANVIVHIGNRQDLFYDVFSEIGQVQL